MAPGVLEETVQWVIQTQRDDGSWGYYDKGTAEETAYCLQALILYRKRVGPVPGSILDKAYHYFNQLNRVSLCPLQIVLGRKNPVLPDLGQSYLCIERLGAL